MKKVLTTVILSILCVAAFAQGYTVKGVVEDALGPVIGATVLEQNTTNGASTGLDGDFTLTVSSKDAMVEVTCIGYKTQTFKASEVPALIKLAEDAMFLDDVVVIGYGSQKKKEVTGSVASVKAEDFNAGSTTNPLGLVQGKVAGLNIIKTTSDPTQTSFNVQIRGFSTLDKGTGSTPLYIVDGVPVSNIDNISPDEIAAMDVLKDGSAAAIYGTRGTNGVILITTKRGDNFSDVAQTRVEYSGYGSVAFRNGSTGMATAAQFRDLANLSGGRVTPTLYTGPGGETYDTDWMKELTRGAALTHSHNLAVTGSASKFNYRASVTYKNAEGIAKNTNRNEIIGKIAANQKALDGWLELQYDLSYMHYRNDYFCGDFKQAAILNPTYPVYDPSTATGYFEPTGTGLSNPVEGMNQKESYSDGNYFRGSIRATVNIKPVPGLKASVFAAMEEGDNRQYWFNKKINTDKDGSGKGYRGYDMSLNKLFEGTVDYVKTFGRHNISAVAGLSYQNFMTDYQNMTNKGFPTETAKYYRMQYGDISKDNLVVNSGRASNTLAAIFARVNYNFAEKYLVSASIRREGSSRFGANHKWGWFPAVSLGWRVSGEDFMASASWVNDLKLRLGYGTTGNNLNSDLRSVAMLDLGGTFWYNGKWVNTYGVTQNVNPDLEWEKKHEVNFGVDYAFLDNRLYGSLDVYYRFTDHLLWDYEVPTPPYQFHTLLANAGKMTSYGVELSISGVPVKTKDLTWTTTPTVSFNRNYITNLSDPSKGFNYQETTSGGVGENGIMNTNTQIVIAGQPVGAFYGYNFYGFRPADGAMMFTTPAAGFVSSENATDNAKQIIGNAQPILTFGWNNTVQWKNWDFTLFLRGVIGNKILNVTRWAYGPQRSQSFNVFMKDIAVNYTDKAHFSSFYLEDGSYLKVDNLTVGYNFKIKENKYIQSARVYLTGQNLLTLTAYSGQDPEVNTTDVWSAGIDYCDFYPRVATVLLGLNITLF